MVAQGIIGSGGSGLSSFAWKNLAPMEPTIENLFAGISNIIFTFGACAGWEHGALRQQPGGWGGGGGVWQSPHARRRRLGPPPAHPRRCPRAPLLLRRAPAGGHAMLLEVMDSMFRPFKFHKAFYWRQGGAAWGVGSLRGITPGGAWRRARGAGARRPSAVPSMPLPTRGPPPPSPSSCLQLLVRLHPGHPQLRVHLLGLAAGGAPVRCAPRGGLGTGAASAAAAPAACLRPLLTRAALLLTPSRQATSLPTCRLPWRETSPLC